MRIQQRLPLLIGILLLSIILTYTWASYRAVNDAALQVGRERLQSLTQQLAALFQRSSNDIATRTLKAASDPVIRAYLRSPQSRSRADVEAILAQFVPPKDQNSRVELLDADHSCVVSLPVDAPQNPVDLDTEFKLSSTGPVHSALGAMRVVQRTAVYPVVAAVMDEGKAIGHLVRWRRLVATAQARQQFISLVGTGASLYLGNNRGDTWTDLSGIAPKPPVDVRGLTEVTRYARGGNTSFLAFARSIPGTPWFVLVEFPEDAVLAPAAHFMERMGVIGLALLVIGLVITWGLSRKITRPLHSLTQVASAIAGGDYSRQASIHTRDELAELCKSFNTMVAQVQESHRNLEQKVQERTSQLQERNQELDAFAYSISHDLRAPLRHIHGFVELLERHSTSSLDDEGRRYMKFISEAAKQMGILIDELLLFSRMGRAEMLLTSVRLDEVVRGVLQGMEEELKDRRIVWSIAPLPCVRGDRAMLRQVLLNLLGNAAKYTRPREEARIEIGTADGAAPEPDQVVVFVRDNGVGFDMNYVHKLFGVFQRLHSAREFEGTGIGLANVRRIIQRHNGRTWAEGEVDRGATFYFSLPLAQVTEP